MINTWCVIVLFNMYCHEVMSNKLFNGDIFIYTYCLYNKYSFILTKTFLFDLLINCSHNYCHHQVYSPFVCFTFIGNSMSFMSIDIFKFSNISLFWIEILYW